MNLLGFVALGGAIAVALIVVELRRREVRRRAAAARRSAREAAEREALQVFAAAGLEEPYSGDPVINWVTPAPTGLRKPSPPHQGTLAAQTAAAIDYPYSPAVSSTYDSGSSYSSSSCDTGSYSSSDSGGSCGGGD